MGRSPARATATDTQMPATFSASIRKNFLDLLPSSIGFSLVTVLATVAVLWVNVDSSMLLVWACIYLAVLFAAALGCHHAPADRFVTVAAAGEAAASTAWALLPVMALARSADWQAMQGMLLLGLMLATLGHATSHRSIHLAATLPIAVISSIVFAAQAAGAARWMAAGFAIAAPFTIASGGVIRQVQSDLFSSSLHNMRLAENLRFEGTRLKQANDQLEIANSHLDNQSRHDTLTGLYNRAGFLSQLNQAVANRPGEVVVCYLDLDGFKRVNDAFGHRFGDSILCAASRRISRVMHEHEVVARQGGDEFTIFGFIDDMPGGVEELGRRLLAVFEDPFLVENRRIEVTASIGLVWLPEQTSADDLMRFADTALYKAKDSGRARFAIFDDNMRAELDSRTQLQSELGAALDSAELTPYLQPIVNIATGEISSAEALVRWEHAAGVRTATEFIDAARDLGMLDRINDTVVQQVFGFLRTMRATNARRCPVTVNVSPLHLDAMLHRVLDEPDVGGVVFEITEDGIFSDMERARGQLERAQAAGIQVLLDDFGVGFSSLSIATLLPIDGFKIDRGFIASLAGNSSAVAAVEAIIQLADRMGLHVVAEGVETIEQLALLRDLGVGYAQGYLFSPAVPMSAFAEWLDGEFRFDVATATTVTSVS